MVRWLRLHAPNAGDLGSVPCQGIRSPHAATEDPAQSNIYIKPFIGRSEQEQEVILALKQVGYCKVTLLEEVAGV